MNNKQYPTRMHEVLGVEPYERFSISSTTPWHGRWLFVDERGDLREEGVKPPFDRAAVFLVNHPECIIRKPRLSEEQVKELKALLVFDKKWLVKEVELLGIVWAFSEKPTREEDGGWWSDEIENNFVMTLPLGAAVNSLVSSSDLAPLDIVATLRDAGVTLTDPNQPQSEVE